MVADSLNANTLSEIDPALLKLAFLRPSSSSIDHLELVLFSAYKRTIVRYHLTLLASGQRIEKYSFEY